MLYALFVGSCLWPSRVTFTASADMLGAYLTSPASRPSCAACPSACPRRALCVRRVPQCSHAYDACHAVLAVLASPCVMLHALMFLVLLVRDCLFQAILDVMPYSPAIHARSEFDLCHICGRTLAFCGVCSRVYARQTLRIGALRCLLSTCQTGVPSGN